MKFLCALCVLCGLPLPARALDREAFTFTRYNLEVRVEPQQQRLGVRGKITLRNDFDSPQKTLSLQISSTLHWSSIQLEGKPVEFISQTYISDIDHTGGLTEAIVTLPRAVVPKDTIEIEIGYEGVIPQDATRLTRIGVPADTAKHSDWDQITPSFAAVRGIGYVTWYPVGTEAASLSDGDEVFEVVGRWKQREAQAEMRIKFSHSGDASAGIPTLYCNGEGQVGGIERMGGAYSISSQCTLRRLGSVVPLFVVGDYHAVDRPELNLSYLFDHKSQAEDYALAAEETAPFVNKWFGDHREKPELKAEVVEIPDPEATPFESGNMLLMPLGGKDTTLLLLSSIQQLTHVVFPSRRGWIYDGLPRYAQLSFLQEKKGRQAVLAYLQNHGDTLVDYEKHISGEKNIAANSLINSPDEFYVQAKAMYVWWMLRDLVGEDALTTALHNYKVEDDNNASYMQRLIEAQAHHDLEWFFDDWVYRDRGLPDFRVVSLYPRQILSGGYMVTVTVENLGEAAGQVPVILRMTSGEASERLLVPGKSKATVRIVAASPPQEVVLNDGSIPESDTTNNVYKIEAPQDGK